MGAPGRQQAHDQTQFVGFGDHRVDMAEVGLVGSGRIPAQQWQVAVGVGRIQSLHLGQHHSLNDRKALCGAVGQIVGRFFQVQPME
ncbi:MAG: hypothetical protein HC802_12280 [Caldilineaceae bacterium]|nr:hypothetical protein [Caldilineaceae bacterium]